MNPERESIDYQSYSTEDLLAMAARFRSENTDLAEKLLLHCIARNDANVGRATFELGRLNLERTDFDEAVRTFDASLSIDPDHNVAMFLAAKACMMAGRYPEAKRRLDELLRLLPNHQSGLILYASVLRALNDNETLTGLVTLHPWLGNVKKLEIPIQE